MLRINGVSKSYGGHELFEKVDLQMNPGERLGLVGRNGHGKSTLFRLILGEEEPDEGSIVFPRGYRTGHLAQHLNFTESTLLAEACRGLNHEDGDAYYKVEKILMGLGFTVEDFDRAPSDFSGGFQIRIELAKVLVSEPNLLLLDEPTNYLDIVSIRWLVTFLRRWKNEMILISHDREFLDSVTTHSALIHRGRLRKLQGTTEKLYAQILEEEKIHEQTRANQEKKRAQEEAFIARFRAKASKAATVQSRIKRLAKMPALEKLAHLDNLDFSFREAPFFADRIIELRDVAFGYDDTPLFQNLSLKVRAGDRIGVIGKNGKGKSTLLNVMASELKPKHGVLESHPDMKIGFFGQTNIQRLHPKMTVEQEIGEANTDLSRTAVRNICGTMMFSGDNAEKKVSVLSGGEKSRVLLGKILATPSNLLLLDEPTNHLDMESIEALLDSLQEFSGAVVIVTHSEMILKDLATKLVVFRKGGVETIDGSYEEFLEKFGWEEEGEEPAAAPSKREGKINKKELRKKRADLTTERSRVLAPLNQDILKLETQITQWEGEMKSANQGMQDASSQGDGAEAAKLGRAVKELQGKIDLAFDRLAGMQAEHDKQSKHFESLLAQLE